MVLFFPDTFEFNVLRFFCRGDKTKRIYKIICSQYDKTEYDYPIKQFRKDFELAETYTNSQIKQKILDPAVKRIKESDSEVWFDYEMYTKYPKNNGRKPMADTIQFRIKSTKSIKETDQGERNNTIYRWMHIAMDYDAHATDTAFNAILQSPRTDEIFNRLCYWEDRIASGDMTTSHVKNSIRKLLRDDFGIK